MVGADHRRSGRPNQDAWYVERSERALIGVVADGCGSAARSELGAWMGARLWARALAEELGEGRSGALDSDSETWARTSARCLEPLRALVHALPGSSPALVHEALLFTLVAFVLTPERLVVHAIGDGLVWLDGELRELGPFADNRPPYLAYGLTGATPPVQIVHDLDPRELGTLILASDGAHELAAAAPGEGLEAFADPRYLARPHAIGRRLAQLNRERLAVDWSAEVVERSHGSLSDDTSVLVLGRVPGSLA